MKKILNYVLALGTCLYLSSCNDFLDREPMSQIPPEDYFTSESSADGAVTGMYRSMLGQFSYGQSFIIVPEFSAKHVNHVNSYPEFINYEQNAVRVDNPWTQNMWQAAYTTINAANNIIARVPEIPEGNISDEKRQQFIGEALFVRSLHYFFLIRAFGNIPMPLEPTTEDSNLAIPQTGTDEAYQQIISDLQTAASDLPDDYGDNATNKGRATSLAAKALLAKIQLYYASKFSQDYALAESAAREVIESGKFNLVSDYASIWSSDNTAESIFELQFDAQATNILASVSDDNASTLFYAKGAGIDNLYEAGDRRKTATVKFGSKDRYYIAKYPKSSPAVQHFPVLRLGELKLIYAEAKAQVDGSVSQEAYAAFKDVRDRAGIDSPPPTSFTSIEQFRTAIQEEKEKELMFEGETWFDYCRTGLALDRIMTVKDPNFFLYPIPNNQIILNNQLVQNPGY